MGELNPNSTKALSISMNFLKILIIGLLSVKFFDPSVSWAEGLGIVLAWFVSMAVVMLGTILTLLIVLGSLAGGAAKKALLTPQVITSLSTNWFDSLLWVIFHLLVLVLLVLGNHLVSGVMILCTLAVVPLLRTISKATLSTGLQEKEVKEEEEEETKEHPIFTVLNQQEP